MERGERHGRRSIRLRGYDYTGDGSYFVTMCTQGRGRNFGVVVSGEMRLNRYGREVANCWLWLAERYPYVYLDEWIVMPDHTHAIIVIAEDHHNDTSNATKPPQPCRDGSRTAQPRIAPNTGSVGQTADGMHALPTQRKPLGPLIGAFKTVSTRRVNDLRSTPGAPLWQRNYHERVVRNTLSLRALRRYVANNTVLWNPFYDSGQ